MDLEYIGHRTVTQTTAKKDSNGNWRVKYVVLQSRTTDGENWEEKALEMNATDKVLDKAMSEVVASVYYYLQTIDNDLFNAEDLGSVMKEEGELLN